MFSTPYVCIDLDVLENNIKSRIEKLNKFGIMLRPHIKTHKCADIAKMQLMYGAQSITVAKLGEAEVFAEAGFSDMLIAYNIIGEEKLIRLERLHKKINVITLCDSLYVAEGLNAVGKRCGKPIEILIELNLGENRCGINVDHLKEFAQKLLCYEGIKIKGLLTYHGSIYKFDKSEQSKIVEMVKEERDTLQKGKAILSEIGITAEVLSAGSSIASYYPEYLDGVTEVRSGNFIFNDINNVKSGICEKKDCALKILSTCVSNPLDDLATLDAGSKTLSSDTSKNSGYGYIVGHENAIITSINEEHSMVKLNDEKIKVGDVVEIIPNHSCVISNLSLEVYGFRKGNFERAFKIDARGRYN